MRETKFAKFPGGACPQTPLEAHAVGANRASLFLLKRGWNVWGSITEFGEPSGTPLQEFPGVAFPG